LLGGKANTSHTHAISDVTGLQSALDGKQPTGSYLTSVALDDLTDVAITTATTNDTLMFNGTNWINSPILGDIESALIAINGV
jgi:hypothetical protein